jgi:TetR/AcrR family transcriptional repressor of multidrug resistance operon
MRPRNLEKEEAIRTKALQIISEEGLENLSMQKLAKAANVSPRTLYIKYVDKDDLLVKLFIDEVLCPYEKAVLENFNESMDFTDGVRLLWLNTFRYLKGNRPAYSLMQYGRSTPLLNKAFQERNIQQGQFFAPIHRFLGFHLKRGLIVKRHPDVQRALLFSPLLDLIGEYFDHSARPRQIITEKVILECSEVVIKGMIKNK